MRADLPAVYMDANVLLAFVSGEAGRAPVVRELLRRSEAGLLNVVTSSLSIVEVAFGAQE